MNLIMIVFGIFLINQSRHDGQVKAKLEKELQDCKCEIQKRAR